MTAGQREMYYSENGDRWFLCSENDGRLFVEHRANLASGGTVSRAEIADFLGHGRAGPEHQALMRLIGSLIEKQS
jgi:hypothetical protein